jgi:predicted HTH transcriptional regulator
VTEEELHVPARRGQGERIEFTAPGADAANIARAIVAVTNSGSGTIWLGVGDDGDLLGLWPRMDLIRCHFFGETLPKGA